ncbi:MAG: hypothetical protein ACOYZ8_05535 [Chloroflexota bacterium]
MMFRICSVADMSLRADAGGEAIPLQARRLLRYARSDSIRGVCNRAFRILLSLLVFLLTACAPWTAPTPTDSGIEGQVFIGPTCPVVQAGTECPDQPYQAVLTVNSLNGQKVTGFQSDEEGRFRVALAPGEYILHPESPEGMPLPFAAEQAFTVLPGQFTHIVVTYDSGIR